MEAPKDAASAVTPADPTSEDATAPGRPRWVTVTLALLVVVAVYAVFALVTGGQHGPGQHTPASAEAPTSAPLHAPPVGGHG